MLWTCIWDMLGLNIRWDTGYFSRWGGGIVPWLGRNHSLPNPFQFIIHPIIQHYTVSILIALSNNPWGGEENFTMTKKIKTVSSILHLQMNNNESWKLLYWHTQRKITIIKYNYFHKQDVQQIMKVPYILD